MRYRVRFAFKGSAQPYYSEWFDTEFEAHGFVIAANSAGGGYPLAIEDEDGETVG